MNRSGLHITLIGFIFLAACRTGVKENEFDNAAISHIINKMTDIMVHDVTNPPLAARFFSYACLAGYEIVAQNDTSYKSLHGTLNYYPHLRKPDSIQNYSYQLAAILSMIQTAKKMQPSGSLLEKYEHFILDSCKGAGYSDEMMENSIKYATAISSRILTYAKEDGYNKISNYKRYTPIEEEGYWYPTPPAYIAAVEPYFNKLRPFILDSCTQFKPVSPVPFSTDTSSSFYKMMLLNYEDSSNNGNQAIAAFWDCNPFAVQDNGHLLVGLKKISPGAHWLGITGIACKKNKKSFNQTMQIYSLVSVGLMDAFICCWDEKYRSNRIRPETAIRKYIDPSWSPLLQTPPFPEYPSGHSVISATSATILTHFFGDNFQFADDSELRYGLPVRKFSSFQQAAEEAGMSRFYGGIHFIDAIDNGRLMGLKVGEWVIKKVKL